MTMSRYQIIFSGQLVHGASREQVQARLFRADGARIATLFSGRRISPESGLEAGEAWTYRVALERAGVPADILPMGKEAKLAPGQENDLDAVHSEAARKPFAVPPQDACTAAFAALGIPDFGSGTELLESRTEAPIAPLESSDPNLAAVGSDLAPIPARPAGALPDISHFRLEPF
ncbi:hypothetical protein GCM10017624_21210 [Azotobacter vinelandii]|nr:hypothetical protein GCM10017624_21210 [Azotobacter vinelandii]